jgi:hypothetical protein
MEFMIIQAGEYHNRTPDAFGKAAMFNSSTPFPFSAQRTYQSVGYFFCSGLDLPVLKPYNKITS